MTRRVAHNKSDRRTLNRIRETYETRKISFRGLEDEFRVSRSVICATANAEGWVRYWPVRSDQTEAKRVETAILVAGLSASESMGPSPSAPKRKGRPKKHGPQQDAAPLTPEQERLRAARELYEASGLKLHRLAARFGFSAGKLHYVARTQKWVSRRNSGQPPSEKFPLSPDPAPPPDRPSEPISEPPAGKARSYNHGDWTEVEIAAAVRTADVIAFPSAAPPPPKKVEVSELPPSVPAEDRAKLRVALAAIRASISVEQVQQLERHEAMLQRYAHVIEVYLEPQRFVAVEGLSAEDAAEKVVTAQKVALRMLLPGKRDTLAGAIKTLTSALKSSIELKRTVVGLAKVGAMALKPADPNHSFADDLPGTGSIIEVETMATEQLRAVQSAMEMLEAHHRKQREPPKPPPPGSIDDLLGPAAEVVKERGGHD